MDDITRADIQAMVLDWAETLAPSTMQTYLRHLSSIFNTALDDEVIRRSPTSRVRLPRARERGDAEFLTTETVERVRDFFGDTIWADAVTVAAGTGLRPSEWAGVTVDRVDVKARTIRVDRQLEASRGARVHRPLKTVASRRTVDYGGRVVDVMERLVGCANHQGLIFHDDGRMLIESARLSAWHRMRSVVPEAGPGWHQLRHFHASFLLSRGASVVAVARRLGHKDATETLRTYAHVMPSDGVALASIMADGGF
ncbi:tyrosine-type recombinase/integrase [Auritidibacter ignavus]|uniref:tyrosine-type recombinase/integrase n=1 Tax=Auritidibacter ignavus TaxID=678932 RepID=UPI0011C3665C|nr:site-specific integrase [Auritidibacter ignavus]NIH70525.1 integrase [Auritidibacter ignavus]